MQDSKNSIKDLMAKKKPILEETPTAAQESKAPKPKPIKKKAEPKADKTTARVQVFMTEDEFAGLSDKAGDVPLSKYVRKALIKAGVI